MRIRRMTATFGKLEHETLTLEPGMNVIHAPNEWGKSTWCAFLMAMFYGIDTRSRTTKTSLADKERYAPWSGSPMEGRIDLNWNGRDITIERRTRGRIPLGEFRAYETEIGLTVPELSANNCGEMLLGVEESIYRRAGFIRMTDMPVTQDESLRRRLNALVTTGDESGDGDKLAQALKDQKNRIRYNRTGMLPQAVAEKEEIEAKLREQERLSGEIRNLENRYKETESRLSLLRNHQRALEYDNYLAENRHLSEAEQLLAQETADMERLEASCRDLPSRDMAEQREHELRTFLKQWNSLLAEEAEQPPKPEQPILLSKFAGLSPAEVREQADRDVLEWRKASGKSWILWMVLSVPLLVEAVVMGWQGMYIFSAAITVALLLCIVLCITGRNTQAKRRKSLSNRYHSDEPEDWHSEAIAYGTAYRTYHKEYDAWSEARDELLKRKALLEIRRDTLCPNQSVEESLEEWKRVLDRWDDYYSARRDVVRSKKQLELLHTMVKPIPAPSMPDSLRYSENETLSKIGEAHLEQQTLQSRIGLYQGKIEAMGDPEALRSQREKLNRRIRELEETYTSLTIAQDTLAAASAVLQRRFAPRITRRAQELLSRMTDGRYDRMTMEEDFSLRAGTREENTLRDAVWRSEGTVDQLYLSLRLAVSEELTPDAPMILDDALARFDDCRMKAAVEILRELSEEKQILLFSCHNRESI